jgi:thiol:disulfide interchange protein DsbD
MMLFYPRCLHALRLILVWLTLWSGGNMVWAQTQSAAVVTTAQVRAELLAHAPQGVLSPDGAAPPIWVGLQLTHQPHWHTYWKNAGDSGLPTTLAWTLPPGVQAGDIAWPLPQKIRIGTLTNYGYEGTVLLAVPLRVSPDFQPPLGGAALPIKLHATWLVCRQECIPQEGDFALSLPLRSSTALHGAAFAAAAAANPQSLPPHPDSRITLQDQQLAVRVAGLPTALRGKTLTLFPETPDLIDAAAESGPGWTQAWDGAVWTARLPLSAQRNASPSVMPLVLALADHGYRVEVKVQGAWPAVAAAASVSPALAAALQANAATQTASGSGAARTASSSATNADSATPLSAASNASPARLTPAPVAITPPAVSSWGLVLALLGALLGGLILNLMPCVFPVLAMKVLGFARHADDQRAHRISGLAYTAGVLASFLALGGLLLALRAAGEGLGWGFQLQNPWVVAALAMLFATLGLNLAGVFEFGQFVPSSVASFQAKHPVADAFLTGMLAVAVASPCTAPFMGASLGLAVSLPGAQALSVFAAIGLGLALPYLLASWIPAVARALPRPGAWMATFRHLLAFPMFATVVWLMWVLGQQSGINGVTALLALLVAVAFMLWTLTLDGWARKLLAPLALAVLALLGSTLGPQLGQMDTSATPPTTAQPTAPGAPVALHWQAWTPEREAALRASGQPVFVDYTAAWCVTCQYNKKTTLAHPAVLADLAAKKVQLLRADWTRRDPAITAALAQLGRNGVPVYVLHQAGQAPVVLSEVLSVDEVRAALARL